MKHSLRSDVLLYAGLCALLIFIPLGSVAGPDTWWVACTIAVWGCVCGCSVFRLVVFRSARRWYMRLLSAVGAGIIGGAVPYAVLVLIFRPEGLGHPGRRSLAYFSFLVLGHLAGWTAAVFGAGMGQRSLADAEKSTDAPDEV